MGARLDEKPEHLFTLRSVDSNELIAHAASATHLVDDAGAPGEGELDESEVSAIFGIEIDPTKPTAPSVKASVPPGTGHAVAPRPAAGAKKSPAPGKKPKAKPGKKAKKIAAVKKGRRGYAMPLSGGNRKG